MNHYMEKKGYPNGIGVIFKAPGDGAKLIPVLEQCKPADAEIFSLKEDEYLLLSAMQKESLIQLLIKSVKLEFAQTGGETEVETSYAIRQSDESTEAFMNRLLG